MRRPRSSWSSALVAPILVAGFLSSAVGCASSPQVEWVRADGSQSVAPEQLARDRADCISSFGLANPTGPRAVTIDRTRMADCMGTRGWVRAGSR